MKRKTPMMKRWFALLLAGLLMVAPAVLAEEEDGAGFGTFFQPEGVELCEVEDAGSLSVPDGLSGLYALMQDCNPFASAYVFRMPKGRALMSVACTTIGNPRTALELLERVGLADRKDDYPRQLSGGQKQRVAIVRALCMHPEILLLDEITAALDPEMVREVLDVVLSLAKAGSTMVIVTHEMNFARAIADRILFIENGTVVEQSDDPKAFFASPETERAKAFLKSFDYE